MERNIRSEKDQKHLLFAMRLSLLVGFVMLSIKMTAYLLTNSNAVLSDAAESVVHVAAVTFAYYSLKLSFRPPDQRHLFGHAKIGFFSAGFEGNMIVIAAIYIIYESISSWIAGLHIKHLDFGTGLTAFAAALNGGLGLYLIRTGKKRHSLILEANGRHVLTDSWTSLGVIVGLALAWGTGWLPWDPIFAIFTALNILYSGIGLIRKGLGGLMDRADEAVSQKLNDILSRETGTAGLKYHNLRHRDMGDRISVEVHLLFPAEITIRQAHAKATKIERIIERAFNPPAYVITHLEAIEDHRDVHKHNPH